MRAELYKTTKPVYIPEISDSLVERMRSHIEPLIPDSDAGSGYRRIKDVERIDARRQSFLWDAEPCGPRLVFEPLNQLQIITFHAFGAPVFFKPSLAEVYAGILRFVPEWERIRFFALRADNLGADNIIGSCHWCRCSLFGETPLEG